MIPAAGRATRLAGEGGDRPKALLEAGGRSLASWLLERLSPAVSDACLVVRPGDGSLEAALGERHAGIRLHYAVQPRPDGVVGAVLAAEEQVRGAFAVAMGDVYYESPLAPVLERWRGSGLPGAVLVEPPRAGGAPAGLVRLRGERVVEIRKIEPGPAEADAPRVCGCFLLPGGAFPFLRGVRPGPTGERELEEAVAAMIRAGLPFLAIPYEGWRRNVNAPPDLAAVRARFL